MNVPVPRRLFPVRWRKTGPDSSIGTARRTRAGGRDEGGLRLVPALLLLVAALLQAPIAAAQRAAASEKIPFDIPSQRADLALIEFAEQADVTFIAPFEEARQKTARRVLGRYTREEAVRILLRGTGLHYDFDDQGTLAVRSTRRPATEGDGMNNSGRNNVLSGVAAAVLSTLGSQAAVGQNAPAAGSGAVEEVVVTATLRQQSLQDVSAAVSSYGQDRLLDAGIGTLEELQVIAPGITITNDFNLAKVFIRGVGLNASVSGTDPAVALHVDGVVISRPEAQLGSLFDLQRVEVLRGPQGTLYGRNSTGGSINLVTAKPTSELDGYARITVGNYDTLEFEGAIGGPITDRILGRIAFTDQDRHEGFGVNPVTGNPVDDRHRTMGRLHLQFLPSDNLDFLLTGEWFYQDDHSGALKFSEPSFPGIPGFGPAAGTGGFASAPRDLASDIDPVTTTDSWAITGTTTWNVTDRLTFTNVTSYRDFLTAHTHDLDISAVRTPNIQYRDVFSEQFSTEIRFNYDTDRISAVFGLFYVDENYGIKSSTLDFEPLRGGPDNLTALQNANVDPFAAAARCNVLGRQSLIDSPAPIIPLLCGSSDLETRAAAAFGQVIYNLNDAVALKLGARYSEEWRFVSNPTTLILGGGAGPVVVIDENTSRNDRRFDSLDPEIGVEWRPADNVLAYYTYSEAFKSGTGLTSLGGVDDIIDPEEMKNHELGLRTAWMDGRLVANFSAFSYDLKNQQVNKVLFDPVTQTTQTRFENAAAASGEGLEVELIASLTDRFRLSANVSWLDAKFEDFETIDGLNIRNTPGPRIDPDTPPYSPLVEQLAGNRLRNAPEWSTNVHIEYDFPAVTLPKDGYLMFAADVNYRSEVYFTEFNTLREGADAVTTGDLYLHYTSGDEHWRGSFWVKNVSDELIPAGSFPIIGRIIGIQYLAPRTYGVTFGYHF